MYQLVNKLNGNIVEEFAVMEEAITFMCLFNISDEADNYEVIENQTK